LRKGLDTRYCYSRAFRTGGEWQFSIKNQGNFLLMVSEFALVPSPSCCCSCSRRCSLAAPFGICHSQPLRLPKAVFAGLATTMTPPLHTTQAVFPAEPDRSLLGHQAPADDEHARQSARTERRSKERRSKPSKDSESGSSGSESSESEDDSWTRWEGVRYLGTCTFWHGEDTQSSG